MSRWPEYGLENIKGRLRDTAPPLYSALRLAKSVAGRLHQEWRRPPDDELLAQIRGIMENSDRSVSGQQGGNATRVLFHTVRGAAPFCLSAEGIMAHALRLRGAHCEFLICDQYLPACQARAINYDSPSQCENCFASAQAFLESFDLPYRLFSQFAVESEIGAIEQEVAALGYHEWEEHTYHGVSVGHYAKASTLRYQMRATLESDLATQDLFRRYLVSAVLVARVAEEVLSQLRPDVVVMTHGIYTSWGPLLDCAKQRGVPVVVYERAYRRGTIALSHDHAVGLDDVAPLWHSLRNEPLTAEETAVLDQYVRSRHTGVLDWVQHNPTPLEGKRRMRRALGLDDRGKVVGLFTNLAWDAALPEHSIVFADMFAWIRETVAFFMARAPHQLVIRVHPAEQLWGSRQFVDDELRKCFPDLPERIKVIPSESQLSTYSLFDLLDTGLVYTSTVGLELALTGVPVVVAARTHYRGKGFTYDPATKAEYFAALDGLLTGQRVTPARMDLAKRYAHLFFIRRCMPFDFIETPPNSHAVTRLRLNSLADLAPGADASLDVICEAILERQPFVCPVHVLAESERGG